MSQEGNPDLHTVVLLLVRIFPIKTKGMERAEEELKKRNHIKELKIFQRTPQSSKNNSILSESKEEFTCSFTAFMLFWEL